MGDFASLAEAMEAMEGAASNDFVAEHQQGLDEAAQEFREQCGNFQRKLDATLEKKLAAMKGRLTVSHKLLPQHVNSEGCRTEDEDLQAENVESLDSHLDSEQDTHDPVTNNDLASTVDYATAMDTQQDLHRDRNETMDPHDSQQGLLAENDLIGNAQQDFQQDQLADGPSAVEFQLGPQQKSLADNPSISNSHLDPQLESKEEILRDESMDHHEDSEQNPQAESLITTNAAMGSRLEFHQDIQRDRPAEGCEDDGQHESQQDRDETRDVQQTCEEGRGIEEDPPMDPRAVQEIRCVPQQDDHQESHRDLHEARYSEHACQEEPTTEPQQDQWIEDCKLDQLELQNEQGETSNVQQTCQELPELQRSSDAEAASIIGPDQDPPAKETRKASGEAQQTTRSIEKDPEKEIQNENSQDTQTENSKETQASPEYSTGLETENSQDTQTENSKETRAPPEYSTKAETEKSKEAQASPEYSTEAQTENSQDTQTENPQDTQTENSQDTPTEKSKDTRTENSQNAQDTQTKVKGESLTMAEGIAKAAALLGRRHSWRWPEPESTGQSLAAPTRACVPTSGPATTASKAPCVAASAARLVAATLSTATLSTATLSTATPEAVQQAVMGQRALSTSTLSTAKLSTASPEVVQHAVVVQRAYTPTRTPKIVPAAMPAPVVLRRDGLLCSVTTSTTDTRAHVATSRIISSTTPCRERETLGHASRPVTPHGHATPSGYAPLAVTPNGYAPRAVTPNGYAPRAVTPNGYATPGRATAGTATPGRYFLGGTVPSKIAGGMGEPVQRRTLGGPVPVTLARVGSASALRWPRLSTPVTEQRRQAMRPVPVPLDVVISV